MLFQLKWNECRKRLKRKPSTFRSNIWTACTKTLEIQQNVYIKHLDLVYARSFNDAYLKMLLFGPCLWRKTNYTWRCLIYADYYFKQKMSNDLRGTHLQQHKKAHTNEKEFKHTASYNLPSHIISTAKYLTQLNSWQLMHSTVQIVVFNFKKKKGEANTLKKTGEKWNWETRSKNKKTVNDRNTDVDFTSVFCHCCTANEGMQQCHSLSIKGTC